MNRACAAVAAFAVAVFISASASAVTTGPLETGSLTGVGPFDLAGAPYDWNGDFVGDEDDGFVQFTFFNPSGVGPGALSTGSIVTVGGFDGDVVYTWLTGGASHTVIAGTVFEAFSLSTIILQGASDILEIRWAGATAFGDLDVVVSAIPLPAGLLLIITAFAGLAIVGRRRRKAVEV